MKSNKIIILYLILVILISKISYSSTTYQENEDSTYCSGDWDSSYPCSNTYDGDWSTRGAVYEGNNEEHEADVIFIYNKSENSTSLSVLQVKEISSSLKNLTIPDSCWYYSDQQVKFKVVLNCYCSHWDCHRDEFGNEDCVCTSWRRNADLYCYNGSWVSMDSWDDGIFYESGIWWNYTSPRSSYPSITDCSGDWYYSSCLNTYDGDWGTYGNTTSADDTTPEKIASVNLTYYKPSHATSLSVLQVKEISSSLKNLTIPDSCWYHSDQQVKFKVVLVSECTHETCHHYGDDIYCDCDEWNNTGSISCYNGSWVSMDSWDDNIFHESEMWWKYPPPSTSISPNGHSWTRDDVSFTLSCTDSGSGCDTTYYKIINDGDSCGTSGYSTGTSGTVGCSSGSTCKKRVCYYSTDNAGNTETVKKSDTFLIDKIAPTYDFTSLEGCDYFNSSSNTCYMLPGHTFNVTIQHHDFNSTPYRQYLTFTNTTCTPNDCGCSWSQECPSGNEIKSYVNVDSDSFTDAMWNDSYLDINSSVCDYPEGCSGYYAEENWTVKAGTESKKYRIWTFLYDQAYNGVGYTLTGYYVLVDNVAPSTSISPNGHSWTKSDVSFTLSCSDSGSGCDTTYYKIINDGDTCPATDDPSYTNSTAGTVTCPAGSACQKRVCYYSVDNVGNVESVHQSNVFYIDKIAPSATISPDGQTCGKDVSFTLSCSDSGSGCNQTYYSIINDGDTCPATDDPSYTNSTAGTVTCPAGSACQKRVCYYSTDNAGNVESVHQSNVFYIDNAPPTSAELRPENRSVVTNGNFSWTTSNDVGCAGLDKYEFQVSTDSDFNNIICSESTAGNNAQCDLENKRIYYVRLRENDSLSNTNDWVTSIIYVDKPVEDHIITIGMEGTNANIPYKNYNWIMFPADLNHYYVCFDGTTITGLIFDGDVFRFIQNGTGGKYYISQNYNGNDLIIPLYYGSCASIDDYISEIEKGIQITSFSLPKHGIAQVIYMIVKLPFNASGNVHFGRGNHKLVIERTSDGLKLYRG